MSLPATYHRPPTTYRLILLDIEGTTTPIDFVYTVLFPYARDHVREFLLGHHQSADVRGDIEGLRKEHAADAQQGLNPPIWPVAALSERRSRPGEQASTTAIEPDDSMVSTAEQIGLTVAYVYWLMDRDRKSTALKSLQGKIWEAGYRSGELRGEVYADVPPAFSRWHRQKKDIGIFSSGSVLAQKLLFAHTMAGDLTRLIRCYFDTTTGAKTEAESYRRMATALGLPTPRILFISDVASELDAAKVARVETALCVRPGRPDPNTTTHPVIHTLDEILP